MAPQNNACDKPEPYDGRYNSWLDGLARKPQSWPATYEEFLAARAIEEQPDADQDIDEVFAAPAPLQLNDDSLGEFGPSYYPSLLPGLEPHAPASAGDQATPSLTQSSSNSPAESAEATVTTPDHEIGEPKVIDASTGGDASTTATGRDHEDAPAARTRAREDEASALPSTAERTSAGPKTAALFGVFRRPPRKLQAASAPRPKEGTAPRPADEQDGRMSRADGDAARDKIPGPPTREQLKRARSPEPDHEEYKERVAKKRGTLAGRATANDATNGGSGQKQSGSRRTPAQSSTAGTTAQPAGSAPTRRRKGSAAPSKPMEECNASHTFKEYARQRAVHIAQAANAILALGPITNASMLPPRQSLTDAVREQLRSIAKEHAVTRRARPSDPGYYACEDCDTDYGLKNEAILTSRKETHTAEYHKGRMCSVCGVLVNGRDFKHALEHRERHCQLWRPLVAKNLHRDWLWAHGFYGDHESMREFWPLQQIRFAKRQPGAAENPAVLRSYLEPVLEVPDVQALQERVKSQAQASRASDEGAPRYVDEVESYHMQHRDTAEQVSVARPTQPEAGPSRISAGQPALGSMPSPSWNRQPGASMVHRGGRDPRDVSGFRVLPNAFGLVYRPELDGAAVRADQAIEADQGRRGTASANTVADSARSTAAGAAPSAEASPHSASNNVSESADITEGYCASWDDEEDDLYS